MMQILARVTSPGEMFILILAECFFIVKTVYLLLWFRRPHTNHSKINNIVILDFFISCFKGIRCLVSFLAIIVYLTIEDPSSDERVMKEPLRAR